MVTPYHPRQNFFLIYFFYLIILNDATQHLIVIIRMVFVKRSVFCAKQS